MNPSTVTASPEASGIPAAPALLTRIEAAAALRVSLRTFATLVAAGRIEYTRAGGRVRISIKELERYKAAATVRAVA